MWQRTCQYFRCVVVMGMTSDLTWDSCAKYTSWNGKDRYEAMRSMYGVALPARMHIEKQLLERYSCNVLSVSIKYFCSNNSCAQKNCFQVCSVIFLLPLETILYSYFCVWYADHPPCRYELPIV